MLKLPLFFYNKSINHPIKIPTAYIFQVMQETKIFSYSLPVKKKIFNFQKLRRTQKSISKLWIFNLLL